MRRVSSRTCNGRVEGYADHGEATLGLGWSEGCCESCDATSEPQRGVGRLINQLSHLRSCSRRGAGPPRRVGGGVVRAGGGTVTREVALLIARKACLRHARACFSRRGTRCASPRAHEEEYSEECVHNGVSPPWSSARPAAVASAVTRRRRRRRYTTRRVSLSSTALSIPLEVGFGLRSVCHRRQRAKSGRCA